MHLGSTSQKPIQSEAPQGQPNIFWKETTGAVVGGVAFAATSFVLIYLAAHHVSLSSGAYWGIVAGDLVAFALSAACIYLIHHKTEKNLLEKYPMASKAINQVGVDAAQVQLETSQINALTEEEFKTIHDQKKALLDGAEKYFMALLGAHAKSQQTPIPSENVNAIKTALAQIGNLFLKQNTDLASEEKALKEQLFPYLTGVLVSNFKMMDDALKEEKGWAERWGAKQQYFRQNHLDKNIFPPLVAAIRAMHIPGDMKKVLEDASKAIIGTIVHQTAASLADSKDPLRVKIGEFFPLIYAEMKDTPVNVPWPQFIQFYTEKFGKLADSLNKLTF